MDQSERGHRGIAIWMLDTRARHREYIGILPKDIWHMILCYFVDIDHQRHNPYDKSRTTFFDVPHSFGEYPAQQVSIPYIVYQTQGRVPPYIRKIATNWQRLGIIIRSEEAFEHEEEITAFPTRDQCCAALRDSI